MHRDHPERRGIQAALAVMAGLSAAGLAWQMASPTPLRGAGMTLDRLSAALTMLVASVGAVVYGFSVRHLDGDPGRPRFLRWLGVTVGSAYVLMLATNLVLLFAAWSLTSLGLHRLLTFYGDRPEALPPARKKFLISRLGDAALLIAIAVVWSTWGTLDLSAVVAAATGNPGPAGDPGAVQVVAVLVAIAALTKSAQFPFHSWLPETMESPTPVSALMHAGIINAGGALLIRFAPIVIRSPAAMVLLSAVGSITAVIGMLSMWAQAKAKRTLAWSTVGQMGFMMIQCGLGAFPAALLHILGHGCYKARSFLTAGELPPPFPKADPASPARTLATAAIGTLAAIPALAWAAGITGFSPAHSPGEMALSAVVAMAIGQVWVVVLGGSMRATRIALALAATPAIAAGALAMYRGADWFLAPVLGELPTPEGWAAWVAATIPVATFAGLTVVHAILPALGRTASGRAFYVHALNGFYLGAIADRLVDRVGRTLGMWEVQNA